jgi:hypothetical protein
MGSLLDCTPPPTNAPHSQLTNVVWDTQVEPINVRIKIVPTPSNIPSRKALALSIDRLDTGHLNRLFCLPACNASVSEHAREEHGAGANR